MSVRRLCAKIHAEMFAKIGYIMQRSLIKSCEWQAHMIGKHVLLLRLLKQPQYVDPVIELKQCHVLIEALDVMFSPLLLTNPPNCIISTDFSRLFFSKLLPFVTVPPGHMFWHVRQRFNITEDIDLCSDWH